MANHSYEVLKIQDFRNFLTGRSLGVIAIHIQAVIVGWQVYDITKDPFSLGLVGLFEIIPSMGVSLLAGHLSDRMSRKKIILNAFFLLTICSFLLLILSTGIFLEISKNVIPIYSIIFLSGIARGFLGASLTPYMAQIVPKHLYHNSAAWNSTTWQMGAVIGPFIGGLMYGWGSNLANQGWNFSFAPYINGASVAYLADLLIMFLSLFFFSQVAPRPVPPIETKEGFKESLWKGFEFVFQNQILLAALSLDMFAVLFGGAVALLPIFASDILKAGPEGLGLLRAAPSLGAAIMAFFLTYRPPKENAGKKLLFSVAGFGLCMILFSLSKNLYLSLFFLALSGMFDSVSVVLRSTIVQTFTPDNMRGRVSAVNFMFIGSSNELGAFESGVAAKLMGTIPSVIFGGSMTLLVVMVTTYMAPKLRALQLGHKKESEN
jgi:MFS family permease